MTLDFETRRAASFDAQGICDVYNAHIRIGGATFDAVDWTKTDVQQKIVDPLPNGWFVACESETILGWAAARTFSDRAGFKHSVETAIYLSPDAQGRGIADSLQQMILDHCVENEIHHAVAKIISTNERSIRFHRRHGYQTVGVQNEIGCIDGQWIDLTIMQRLFGRPSDD